MTQPQSISTPPARRLLLPRAPVLVLDGRRILCLTTDGELKTLTVDAAKALVHHDMPILCNAPRLAGLLGVKHLRGYDVMELYAFVHPGQFAVPTPRGLARALNLFEPENGEDECASLRDSIRHLLVDLTAEGRAEKSDPAAIAAMMGLAGSVKLEQNGWPWTETVLAALGRTDTPPSRAEIKAACKIWDKLPEWSIHAPEPPAGHHGVEEEEISARLARLLSRQRKEERAEQRAYAASLAPAFAPRDEQGPPHAVLAEAGTGVGKTIGYLSPATVWAEKNGGPVWISTFTRNLQRQVDAELDRLYDDPVTKSRKVVTRKGRENYLCLLNLEDASESQSVLTHDLNATALGLMLRWAAVTEDGDLAGKDFPGWLSALLGRARVAAFADRRGECIYSACPHFHKCFVEKSVRKSKRADIVIANHALVMHQVAGNTPDVALPARYVFDEGHHLFEAADGAFGSQLTGAETADLRRWLLGTETDKRSRARGIKRRLEDLIAGDDDAARDIEAVLDAAQALPAPSWRQRLWEGAPKGVAEKFLALCRQQVIARNSDAAGFYSLEAETHPTIPELPAAAAALRLRLNDLMRPMLSLAARLEKKLVDEADTLDTDARERIRFVCGSLDFRARGVVGGWVDMLDALAQPAGTTKDTVDWLEVTRIDGHDYDIGLCRAYVDPARVFASQLAPHAHGVVVTSATLRDASDEDPAGWDSALTRTGAEHLGPPHRFHVVSPFDYKNRTRVLVVGDVRKDSADEVAAAYRELFKASGGGALGIFTAVQRLRAVYDKAHDALERAGLRLYAQHVDPLDISTLIDIFREEENACLLGTDATRDGIDVPGRSLRLVIYDRVPWPRPTLLHKARRLFFGKSYDDMLTRFRLKQAYGRLIRRADDRGIFVMLDGAMPTRLTNAFPEGVTIERVGLKEALEITRTFLKETVDEKTPVTY